MRKTKLVIVPGTKDETRDAGKAFLITEMPAVKAEKWAMRALLAVASSGADIPPEVVKMGAAALMAAGFRALLTMAFADAEPLIDEMMQCVVLVPDRTRQDVTRPVDEDDIEEVSTLMLLRSEVIELHTGFSPAAFLSKLGAAARTTGFDTENTQTSPDPSAPPSVPGVPPS